MKTFWSQRNPRERVMLVLCVAVVLVGGWLALAPTGGNGKKLLPAPVARQKREDAAQQKEALDTESARFRAELAKMTYAKAPEQVVPEVVRLLHTYAKESGIRLREIKLLRARRLSGVTKVPLSVRFTTEFEKSVPFLYRVEDPKGKLVVEKFNVNASDPKSRAVDVEAQVALYTRTEAGGGTGM